MKIPTKIKTEKWAKDMNNRFFFFFTNTEKPKSECEKLSTSQAVKEMQSKPRDHFALIRKNVLPGVSKKLAK